MTSLLDKFLRITHIPFLRHWLIRRTLRVLIAEGETLLHDKPRPVDQYANPNPQVNASNIDRGEADTYLHKFSDWEQRTAAQLQQLSGITPEQVAQFQTIAKATSLPGDTDALAANLQAALQYLRQLC